MKAYEQEGRAYTWLIPALQKTRSERNLKPLAFPKCLYSSLEDSILILENMKEQNYQVVEKKPESKLIYEIKNKFKLFVQIQLWWPRSLASVTQSC